MLAGGRAHHEADVVQARNAMRVAREHVLLLLLLLLAFLGVFLGEVFWVPVHFGQGQTHELGPHPTGKRVRRQTKKKAHKGT